MISLVLAFSIADRVMVEGYECDTFDLNSERGLVGQEDVIQFKFKEQDISLDSAGDACVIGWSRETDLADWSEPTPRWINFEMHRPMTERDTQ